MCCRACDKRPIWNIPTSGIAVVTLVAVDTGHWALRLRLRSRAGFGFHFTPCRRSRPHKSAPRVLVALSPAHRRRIAVFLMWREWYKLLGAAVKCCRHFFKKKTPHFLTSKCCYCLILHTHNSISVRTYSQMQGGMVRMQKPLSEPTMEDSLHCNNEKNRYCMASHTCVLLT